MMLNDLWEAYQPTKSSVWHFAKEKHVHYINLFCLMFVDDGNDEKPSYDARDDEKSRSCYEQSGSKSSFCLSTFWTHMQQTRQESIGIFSLCVCQSFVANSNISVIIKEGFEVPQALRSPLQLIAAGPQKSSSLYTYHQHQTTYNFCTINDEQNLGYFFTWSVYFCFW